MIAGLIIFVLVVLALLSPGGGTSEYGPGYYDDDFNKP